MSRGIVISPPGEVLSPEIHNAIERQQTERSVIRAELIELKKRELSIQEQKLALRSSQASLLIQTRLEDRKERIHRRHCTEVAKSRLIEAIVFIDPLDYEIVGAMLWAYATQRDPLLRLVDVMTGRGLKDSRFVIRCFPEHRAEILHLTGEMFERRNAVPTSELIAVAERAQKLLEAEAQGEWPKDDPK